jgi:predicted SnoaL-like aldol condensation-catalyzing enzyme
MNHCRHSLYGNTCRFRLYPVPTILYTNLSIIPERQMSQHDNEALAHRFHMDIFQKGELRVADEILASNFVWRNPIIPAELQHGPDGVKKIATAVIEGMPDRQITHDDTVAKNDKVLIRWTITGTPKRELFGISPSDKPTTICGLIYFIFLMKGRL